MKDIYNPLHRKEKLWSMSPKQLKDLWLLMDTNHNNILSTAELFTFAKSYFNTKVVELSRDVNQPEEKLKQDFLHGKKIQSHLLCLKKQMDVTMDMNKDGKITKREFVIKWNATAKKYFANDSACCIM
jgi:hypothetical protein